jgi:hypothetical protein
MKLRVAFRNFANAPKNGQVWVSKRGRQRGKRTSRQVDRQTDQQSCICKAVPFRLAVRKPKTSKLGSGQKFMAYFEAVRIARVCYVY